MRIRTLCLGLTLAAGAVAAQDRPLSAIDWLSETPQLLRPGNVLLEPPVAGSAENPVVEVTPLEALSPPVGLVPQGVTGLPVDAWKGSQPEVLARLIANAPVQDSPAMQSLLYTLLLADTRPPDGPGAGEILLLARIDRLMELGATDPARELAQIAGPTDSAARFHRWFDATLLTMDGRLARAHGPKCRIEVLKA